MDLIDDLGNDLVFAFLVERKHRQKIDSKDVSVFIGRFKAALKFISTRDSKMAKTGLTDQSPRAADH